MASGHGAPRLAGLEPPFPTKSSKIVSNEHRGLPKSKKKEDLYRLIHLPLFFYGGDDQTAYDVCM
jgi:hypothetical protein